MHYVYILELENGQYYTGYSTDLKTRITRHRQGSTTTTARVKPRDLVFYAAFESKQKARDFEQYLKTKSGWAFRNKHLVDVNQRSM
ncbi:GIY-YIG nuclease family protein [Candidatus Berkelbacteria bacterium]|nr:GIY-YIG nuclease family protein [Candidatus Berkelbacteria bacterium]